MAINASDIKLLESEVMADTTDGGGRRTSRVIPDGVAGNIFPKVSRLDSVYGRVNLRKVYGAVQTANVDTYAGSHAVVTDAPDNDKIHTTLFSTSSEFDNRAAARDRIESYVTSGPESRMTLLGRQLPGQQTILVYQRVEEPILEIGEVFCLSNEAGSVVTSQQYVRVQDLDHEIRTFEDGNGTFQRRVITIDVGVALRYEFNGPETASRYSNVTRPAKVRSTTVVDAARYFGIKKLAEAAGANDLTIRVESVYTNIVPTTNRETPISNENISDAVEVVAASAATATANFVGLAYGVTQYTPRPIVPGTLVIAGVTDDKKGGINGANFVGTVDYEIGAISRTGGAASSTLAATYTPGVSVSQPAHTVDVPVDLNNRGTVYVLTLNPLPAPGSIIVDYRALGKWYRLRDDGTGALAGTDAAYGVGVVTYSTGALVLTLGALPDVDSSVLVSFGSPAHFAVRTNDASSTLKQIFTLPDLPINPNSFSLNYIAGGTTYSALDDIDGTITGDGITGRINYTSGRVELNYTTRLPDASSNVSCSYQQIVPSDPQIPVGRSLSLPSGANMSLADSVVAGSVLGSATFSGTAIAAFSGSLIIQDTGLGTLMVPAGQTIPTGVSQVNAQVTQSTIIGTINYATGAIVINTPVPIASVQFNQASGAWLNLSTHMTIAAGPANFGWKSSTAASANGARTYDATFTAAPLKFDITATIADQVCAGSIMFTLGGKTYIDRNGILYNDVSTATGAGTTAGAVNYETGEISISQWTDNAALGISVAACATQYGVAPGWVYRFRTPGSPVRPGSFYVQATTVDGTLVSATSNENGEITGSNVVGTVNQETGVVRIAFGQTVTAAGNESEWWYNPANVVGGQIFKPTLIQPATLLFNCVVLANLPLNADILGLDPVRLPSDGRVPIYRPADVVVIHNTQAQNLTNPIVPGNTYSVGRANVAEIWVTDTAGTKLNASQYAYDLTAGTVTIAADFTVGALVQPLVAHSRVEDMGLLSDVQINGQLTLAAPLSRSYPLNSYVSSALLFGDLNSRVTNVHDLLSFSTWTDTPGTGSNAQYNNLDFPIEVLNNGSMNERWRLNFTSTTAFQIIGENLGVIGTGSTGLDCSPTNPLTGLPYFVVRAGGWGSGWAAGNQLRFNTIGAGAPIWIARTVLPGATLEGDSFSLQMRGDVDAE